MSIPDYSNLYKLIDKIGDVHSNVNKFDVIGFNNNIGELSKLNGLKSSLTSANTDLEGEINNWNQQLELRKKIEDTISQISTKIDGIAPAVVAINTTYEKLPETISGINDNLQKAIGLLENVPTRIQGISSQITDFSNSIGNVDTVVSGMKGISEEIIPVITNLKNVIDDFNVAELETGIEDDLGKIKSTLTSINSVKDKLTDIEKITEIDEIQEMLSNIPQTLESMKGNLQTISDVMPTISQIMDTFNKMIANGEQLTTDLTGKMADTLKQVADIETYLKFMNDIHDAIGQFSPSMEDLANEAKRIGDYGDIGEFIKEPIDYAKSRLGLVGDMLNKIIDFLKSLPQSIMKLIGTILNTIIEVITKAITDYLPTLIIIIVLIMVGLYLYPTIIGIII